jgi:type VI secretion system secreted protein VgrG
MPESTRTQKNRHAAVTSALDEDVLLLRRFHGVEHLGGIFEYELELISEKPDEVDVDEVLGGPMTVRLELADGTYRYFNGLVSRFVLVSGEAEFPTYHATVVPWIWALTRAADCRIFHDTARQEWNVPKIVLWVFRDFGASAFRDALSGTYQNLEYTVQYAETAFNFVSRLLEREGIYYFFEHTEDAHTLVLADAPTAHEPIPDYDALIYRGRDRAHPGEEHISRWEIRKQVQPGAVALGGFDFKQPKNDLKVRSTVSRPHPQSDFEVYDYHGAYTERDVGEHYARVRLEEFQSQHEVIHGEANVRGLACGYTFKVTGLPGAEEQEFLVTSARYTIVNDAYASNGSGAEEPFLCHFTAIPATQTYRPPRVTPRPLIRGPQTAMVVGPAGEEIHTDEYGRVRVQFPWDRRGEYNEKSSCWIRVSQAWAGKKWGIIFTPRVGNEVIVEYLEGDPDRPVITGRVYNGDSMPPYELPAYMTMSTLKTISSKGGDGFNEIRFEDKKGEEQLFIHAQKRMDQRVRGSLYETNYGNREVRVGWEKDGSSGGDLNVYVHQNLSQHVKKHQYELVEEDYNYTVSGEVALNYEKNWTMSVGQKCTIASTDFVVECDAGVSYKSATFALTSSGAIDIKGGTVNIEGSTGGVNIKVGGNFVVVNTSGVSINGTTVMINSGGSASPAADAKKAEVGDLTDPLDAAVADDGKPGKNTKYSGGGGGATRQWKKRTPKKHNAPPWIPPPPPPPPPGIPIPPPPPPTSTKPCGIKDIVVKCGHKGRTAGAEGILQVVATAKSATSIGKEFGKVAVEAKVTKGGEEQLTIEIRPMEGLSPGRRQSAILRAAAPPSDDQWKGNDAPRNAPVSPPSNDDLWAGAAEPDRYYVYGRGCDDVMRSCIVESFPSQQTEFSVSLDPFKKLSESITKWLDEHCKKSWGDVTLGVSAKLPSGKIKGSCGWKEEEDWRAYFAATVGVEITVFELKVTGKWNLRDTAIRATLTAVGVPPPITQLIFEIKEEIAEANDGEDVMDYLAQIFVELSLTGAPKLSGELTKKMYASGTGDTLSGDVKGAGEVTLELKLVCQVGSEKLWNYVKLEGKATTGVSFNVAFALQKDGLWAVPTIEFPGIDIEVSAALMVCKVTGTKSYKWSPLPASTLYPSADNKDPAKWHLIGPDSAGSGGRGGGGAH